MTHFSELTNVSMHNDERRWIKILDFVHDELYDFIRDELGEQIHGQCFAHIGGAVSLEAYAQAGPEMIDVDFLIF